ncbi:MAG: hypothetical protein E6K31_12615 [Gammaproteobacteria bacterium]|nr:MAG: hypothetical protein E6K31_12615 [Gammaproteobacteria bacterium]
MPAISTLVAKRASAESGGAVAPDHWTEGPHYADVPQLLAAGFAPDALLLTPGDARQAAIWLESIRRAPRLALLPIFLNRAFGEAVDALSDGVASTPEAAAPEAAAIAARAASLSRRETAIAARAASLSRRETAEGDERLLAFLYLRPERVLTPAADWRDERIYRYPLADALGRPGEDSFLMLERLRRRGLLETAGLVERVHTCPSCSAGQLLFVETCPQCGSIDTAEQNFLHCYSCGHVGTQDEYLTNEGLACPKCAVRLRHIGVDYDRALETFACKDCSGRFTEPNVKARCLRCRKTCGTDALAERNYYGLQLSAAGELAARTGQVGDLFKLLDEFSHAHPEYSPPSSLAIASHRCSMRWRSACGSSSAPPTSSCGMTTSTAGCCCRRPRPGASQSSSSASRHSGRRRRPRKDCASSSRPPPSPLPTPVRAAPMRGSSWVPCGAA